MVNVKNITYTYNTAAGAVLDNVGFSVESGQCIAILGNNGAGKSTLLKCIDRIFPTKDGVVEIDGKDISSMAGREMARYISYVPQNAGTVSMTVFDTVLMGRKPYIRWNATQEDQEIVFDALHQMGLDDYALRNVSELSGGEVQKVMLARALAQRPKFLLLDEPTSNLDPRNQHEVLRDVQRLARENHISVAIIIHDLNLAIRYCDRFLFLKNTHVYAYGGMEVMSPRNIEAVYGMSVQILYLDGIPVIVPFPQKVSIQGQGAKFTNKNMEQGASIPWSTERQVSLSTI